MLSIMDLFAGCGGLSLGFEQAGFTPIFVNELNDDARATYLANRHHSIGEAKFSSTPALISSDVAELDESRLVRLSDDLQQLGADIRFGKNGSVDVVAGGPPCQGFSGIGHRRSYGVDRSALPSNQLFQNMASVIEFVRPRIFLFENVRGLLSARWSAQGERGEIWRDVFGRFRQLGDEFGYTVRWSLVHAKDYGVPQNRPRILLVGIRNDVIVDEPDIIDVTADEYDAIKCGFLPKGGKKAPHLNEVLGDLVDPSIDRTLRSQDFPASFKSSNYVQPANSEIQKYFRPGDLAKKGAPLTEQEYSKHALKIVEKFSAMQENGGVIPDEFTTKKFAQRLLPAEWAKTGPFITATSMPDDYVHFCQPRILTVREWARLQTFPDWYEFRGKRTTGGLRRAGNPRLGIFDRETPKYTQIGNAVPVSLASAVGEHFKGILASAGFITYPSERPVAQAKQRLRYAVGS
ncbi:DNA cytosine methyltransferase [Agrobacterium deltaense]